MASIKFNDIPNSDFNIEAGEYPFVILDAKLVTTTNGFKCIEFTYEHLGSPKFKVNFDKCIYGNSETEFDMSINAIRYGLQKLKKLNEATVKLDDLDPAILARVLIGKKVIVKIKMGDKYPEIDGTDAFKAYEEPQAPQAPTSFTIEVDPADDPFNM